MYYSTLVAQIFERLDEELKYKFNYINKHMKINRRYYLLKYIYVMLGSFLFFSLAVLIKMQNTSKKSHKSHTMF